MPKTRNHADKQPDRAMPAAKRKRAHGGDKAERPPESAEDFAHVLRRLMSARDERDKDAPRGA
jgi:hypothetical protein